MAEFRTFREGEPRPLTWVERERSARLREEGIESVYLEPEEPPQGFWDAVLLLAKANLAYEGSQLWEAWTEEMTYNGLPLLGKTKFSAFEQIIRVGESDPAFFLGADQPRRASTGERLSAVEHLLDVADDQAIAEFAPGLNDRARYYRVGLRLEGRRFVPVTSEHLHKEVVESTLVLLSEDRFTEIDGLYRKAFDRVLSGDASGAITVAISAVEEMLRVLLPEMRGQTLTPLAEKARAEGLIAPAVEEFIKKLYALRPDSDAHAGGTSDFDLAMLALHLTASILLYLSKTEE